MPDSPETLKARVAFQWLARDGSAVLPELQQPRRACGTCRKDKTQLHLGAKCSVCARRTMTKGCLRKGREYPWPAAANGSFFSCDVGAAPVLAAKRPAPAATAASPPAPSPQKRPRHLRQDPQRTTPLVVTPTKANFQDRAAWLRKSAGEMHGSLGAGGVSITLRLRRAKQDKRELQARNAAAAAAAAEEAAAVFAEEQLLGDTGLNFRQLRALGLPRNDWCL